MLATGEQVIAETTRRDKIWGIGVDMNKDDAKRPWVWGGKGAAGILGYGLMYARERLRVEGGGAN